jgi:peptidoglycan/LPS O-acetylase OafA/YrhL
MAPDPGGLVSESRGRFNRPELDALRFGAFLLVFCAHAFPFRDSYVAAQVPEWIWRPIDGFKRGGGYGVDLFFLLSAYLITEILLRERRRTDTIDVRAFWIRRILRIWPLYFFALALAFWIVPRVFPDQHFPPRMAFAYATFWGNFVTHGFPGATTMAAVLWSVSIEEQFYLTWPLVVLTLRRHIGSICIGLIAVANVARIIFMAGPSPDPLALWYNTLTRLDPIALGALLAVTLDGRLPSFRNQTRIGLFATGLILFTVAGMYFRDAPDRLVLVGYPVGALGSLCLFLGFLGTSWRLGAVPIYLGRISYGLYVFHLLAIAIARTWIQVGRGAVEWGIQFGAALGITILMAAISYRYLESPFLRLKDRFSRDDLVPVTARIQDPTQARRRRFSRADRAGRLRIG